MYHLRDTILQSMARTLWVTAYINEHDSAPQHLRDEHPSAGGGDDWMDIVPPTPPGVLEEAEEWLYAFEMLHEKLVYSWLKYSAPWVFNDDDDLLETLDSFGHYLVMNMSGSGVGLQEWCDKSMAVYVKEDLRTPYREQYKSSDLAYLLIYGSYDEYVPNDDDDD